MNGAQDPIQWELNLRMREKEEEERKRQATQNAANLRMQAARELKEANRARVAAFIPRYVKWLERHDVESRRLSFWRRGWPLGSFFTSTPYQDTTWKFEHHVYVTPDEHLYVYDTSVWSSRKPRFRPTEEMPLASSVVNTVASVIERAGKQAEWARTGPRI